MRLGSSTVATSPLLFSTQANSSIAIWKVIRGWLDPVVAAKVHLTHGRKGIEEFIAPEQLIKELGGDEEYEYEYIEPVEGENDLMKDTKARDQILKVREGLQNDFEEATIQWIREGETEDGKKANVRRHGLAANLRANYWDLDPYVRARSYWDRAGVICGKAGTKWYASEKQESKAVTEGTHVHVETVVDVGVKA